MPHANLESSSSSVKSPRHEFKALVDALNPRLSSLLPQLDRACARMPSDLLADRRGSSVKSSGDGADRAACGNTRGNLFPLNEGEYPRREAIDSLHVGKEVERPSPWRRGVAACGATHRLTRGQFARKLGSSLYLRKRQEFAACIPFPHRTSEP
jgi:hypothetical protein